MGKRKLKSQDKANLARHAKPVKLETPWDTGAPGYANRVGMMVEEAADRDPETGKVVNPNRVMRVRKFSPIEQAAKDGLVTRNHLDIAITLKTLSYGAVPGGGDPLGAIIVRAPGSDNGLAASMDRRRRFFDMWGYVPAECQPAIEAVILNDVSVEDYTGKRLDRVLDTYARIRVGLGAVERA